VAERSHVDAARLMGVPARALVLREVLPTVVPTMVSFALLTAGLVLVAESSLSFLGLSVEAPTLTWGSIIAEGRIAFRDTPHMVFLPALVLFVTVVALNLLGDRLTRRLDGREARL
jgi:peptide/nickel transport system permease protein